ncbi:MAG: hypothetical protein ACK2UO_02945 [Caldilineaceae bacterium]|jgi:hypothetical protein
MPDLEDFVAHLRLAETLIEKADKDQLADVARLLALNIGYYQNRYGDVPQDVLLEMVRADALDESGREMVVAGMQNLVSALAEVMGVKDDLQDKTRH